MDIPRDTALRIINGITTRGAFSGQELDKALSNAGNELSLLDRAFITELVYGTMNRLYTIDRLLETYSKIPLAKLESSVLAILRLAVYQLKFMDRVPDYAVINEAVNQARRNSHSASGFVNGILRSILRNEKRPAFKSKAEKLSYDFSMPLWITDMMEEQYPRNFRGILSALSRSHGVTLRLNPERIEPSEYKDILTSEDYRFKEGKVLETSLTVENPGDVRRLPGFSEGTVSVQNESASIVSWILDRYLKQMSRNGKEEGKEEGKEIRVLDICAAPGGKSTYLAELGREYSITAADLHPHRVKLMEDNFRRAGMKGIRTMTMDATEKREDFKDSFHGIIADVPCSGFGLMGRKPDIKINISPEGINEIIPVQRRILDNCADYLKSGGYLIYSTCTLNKNENERNISWFLERHEDFSIVENTSPSEKSNFIDNGGMVTILPDDTLDGFFFTLLRKK